MARRVPLSAELYGKILNAPTFQVENFSNAQKTGKDAGDTPRETAELVYRTFYRADATPKDTRRMSKEPGRPLARFLERIGLREEGAKYKVGESPKRRRKR